MRSLADSPGLIKRLALLGALLITLALGGGFLAGCAPDNQAFVDDVENELRAPDEGTPRALAERVRAYLEMEHVRVAPRVVRASMILSGLVLLIAGWKVYRFLIAAPGLVLGALIGARFGASEGDVVALIGLLIGAGLGSLLALIVHDVTVFGAGAYLGASLALELTGWNPTLMIIAGGLIGGALVVALFYLLLVAVTAALGATLIGAALGASPLVMALLAGVGLLVQYNLARALGDRPAPPRARKRGDELPTPAENS